VVAVVSISIQNKNCLKRKRNKMDNIDNEEYNSKKILDINETIYFNFIQSSDSLFSNNKNLPNSKQTLFKN